MGRSRQTSPDTPHSDTTAAPKPFSKGTRAQIARRVTQVFKLLILGKTRAFIVQFCADQWEIEERQADEYIARANDMIEAQAARTREDHMKIALQRLDAVFGEAFEAGEFKDALGAQHQVNKIIGLYAPTQQNVNVTGNLTWAQMVQQSREGTHDDSNS